MKRILTRCISVSLQPYEDFSLESILVCCTVAVVVPLSARSCRSLLDREGPFMADKRRRSRLDGRLCLCCAALDGYRHRAVLALRELLGRKKLQLLYLLRESRLLLQPSVQHRGPQGM